MKNNTIITLVIGLIIGVASTIGIASLTNSDDNKQVVTTEQRPSTDHSSMTMADMNKQLEKLSGDEFDKTFIEMMTVHHEGAVAMAELIPTRAKHDEIKTLGIAIIAAQTKEIAEMEQWQMDWGYTTSGGSTPGMNH